MVRLCGPVSKFMTPMSKWLSHVHQRKSANNFRAYPRFFVRVDRVLRRSLGVSETAKAKVDVKPAPEVDPTEPEGEFELPDFPEYRGGEGLFDDSFMKPMVLDKDTGEMIHDEL